MPAVLLCALLSATHVAAAPGEGKPPGDDARQALLERVERLEAAVRRAETRPLSTSAQLDQQRAALERLGKEAEALERETEALVTHEAQADERAHVQLARLGEALTAMQTADVALATGTGDVAVQLAAASVALQEAENISSERDARAQLKAARCQLDALTEVLGEQDPQEVRGLLFRAHALTQLAQATATEGDARDARARELGVGGSGEVPAEAPAPARGDCR